MQRNAIESATNAYEAFKNDNKEALEAEDEYSVAPEIVADDVGFPVEMLFQPVAPVPAAKKGKAHGRGKAIANGKKPAIDQASPSDQHKSGESISPIANNCTALMSCPLVTPLVVYWSYFGQSLIL